MMMRRLWFTKLLVALVLMISTSAPSLASTLGWFCDGRLCGLSLCCCDQPDIKQADPKCIRPRTESTASTRQPALCRTECGCTPVFTGASEHPASRMPTSDPCTLPVFVYAAAPITPAPLLYAPLIQVLLPDYRGPPTAPVSLPSSGLRAPPAS
ncbi:hypothetical protein [Armatimonas sp.]|uniref:hypothetical protein n=1 Tax=Armatimonas sp. TaxID=1872638 RepID=UPI003750986F